MPYIIKKAKGGPIPLKRAKAQRRAIGFFSRR